MEEKIKAIQLSAAILKLVLEGKAVDQAFDAVIGEGAYKKMAGQIYDELRAKSNN